MWRNAEKANKVNGTTAIKSFDSSMFREVRLTVKSWKIPEPLQCVMLHGPGSSEPEMDRVMRRSELEEFLRKDREIYDVQEMYGMFRRDIEDKDESLVRSRRIWRDYMAEVCI